MDVLIDSVELNQLARSWLEQGATRIGVWRAGRRLACWPPEGEAEGPYIAAVVGRRGSTDELRAYGVDGDAARARLNADAALLGRIVASDAELEAMTDDLLESQDQLVALYDLARSTKDLLSVDAVLASVTREAARLVRAEAAFAIVASTDPPCIVHHPVPKLTTEDVVELFSAARDDRQVLARTAASDDIRLPSGVQNIAVAPMEIRGELTAGLGLVNREGGPFASPDLKLIRTLADQAAARIENVLLHAEAVNRARVDAELSLAQRVQTRLLPTTTPNVRGLQAWAQSQPALQVGGDFFDLIPRSDGMFVFALGDVSGKGMPAALLMVMTRTVLRGMARFVPLLRSDAILTRANDDLYDDFTEVDMFATGFVAVYDPATRVLSYANAGHAPVIYCPSGGEPTMLTASGLPLGILPHSSFDVAQLTLGIGDVLVAATDGFNEALSPGGEMYGYDRFLAMVQELAVRPADEIGRGLFVAVEAYGQGRQQDDDQTLVVLKGVPV